MDGWREQFAACWASVAVQLPSSLQSSLSQLGHSIVDTLTGSAGGGAAAIGQEYELHGRRLRVVRQLGEGGYSFVYLVQEVAAGGGAAALLPAAVQGGQQFALKRVLCGSEEQVREAQHEVEVMRRLCHPCLLPLLDSAALQQRTPDGAARTVFLMLFPVYAQGNLFDFVQQRRRKRQLAQQAPQGQQAQHAQQRRDLRELLQIFCQVCAALHSMHSMRPALAHRDVKPQNVLLRMRGVPGGSNSDASAAEEEEQQQQQQHGGRGSYDPVPPIVAEAPGSDQPATQHPEWEASGWDTSGSDGAGGHAPAAADAAAAAVIPVDQEGQPGQSQQHAQQQQQKQHAQHMTEEWWQAQQEQWWEARMGRWQERYEAVLMDFGSTRTVPLLVCNRAEAMAAQEDADRQCTAPYRTPELWDVPSSCTIDERVDVWSLGCLLYFMLCGQSPFERAVGETGGSLMLAVLSGRLSWPEDVIPGCPDTLRQLVSRCLDLDPSTRPRVGEVAAQADRLLTTLL